MSQKEVMQSVYDLLSASPELAAQTTGVFDEVPEETRGDYVVVGQMQSLRGRLLDDSERRWYVDVHIWSSYAGRKRVLEIADIIVGLVPPEWYLEELTIIKDGGWWHGVATLSGYSR